MERDNFAAGGDCREPRGDYCCLAALIDLCLELPFIAVPGSSVTCVVVCDMQTFICEPYFNGIYEPACGDEFFLYFTTPPNHDAVRFELRPLF